MNTLSGTLGSIKKILYNLTLTNDDEFDHSKAQIYEMKSGSKWLDDNFEIFYEDICDRKRQKHVVFDEFFKSNYQWNKFIKYIENKICLEIGSGPMGMVNRWYWAKKRIIIDPLVSDYKKLSIKKFGKSLFTNDIILYPQNAEIYIPRLSNKIDGAIVCRNTLDHCENPVGVIQNISEYAKVGCYLLLWSDLYHKKGHDAGHRNITKSKTEFESLITKGGFEIQHKFSAYKRNTVNYGCLAIKKSRTISNWKVEIGNRKLE